MRLGLGWIAMVAPLAACQEPVHDASERAASAVFHEVRSLERFVEQALDTTRFRQLRSMYESDAKLPPPEFDGERWTFRTTDAQVSYAFSDRGGALQNEPDDDTDRMESLGSETLVGLLGLTSSSAEGAYSSITTGLGTATVEIAATHFTEIHHDIETLVQHLEMDGEAAVTVTEGCPSGSITGTVTAWGYSSIERRGETNLAFEAHFEGNELVWQSLEDGAVLESDRLLTGFPAACP